MIRLYTRRQALLAFTLSVSAGGTLITGCGSGKGTAPTSGLPATGTTGAGGNAGSVRSTGRVILPPGFPLSMPSLKLASGLAPATLRADGSFTLDQNSGDDAALLVLTDARNQPLLFGFSGDNTSHLVGEVSPLQTAIALVFYALGAFTLPAAGQRQVRALLAQEARVRALGSQVATTLAATPLAIAQSDSVLFASVTALRDSLLGTNPFTTAPKGKAAQSHGSRQTIAPTLLSVAPSSEQSGMLAASNATGLGLTITNTRRRNALVYIYQTASTQDGNTNFVYNRQLVNGDIIFATSAYSGVVGSLIDFANGTEDANGQVISGAYVPVTTGPYSLDLFPAGASQAEYNIDIIGNGTGGVGAYSPDYSKAYLRISFLTFVKDLLLPAIATLVGFQSSLKLDLRAGTGVPGTDLRKAYDDLAATLSGVIDTSVAIDQSAARAVLIAVLKALGNNGTLRQKVINWVGTHVLTSAIEHGGEQGVATGLGAILASSLAAAANAMAIVVDKLLGTLDLGKVLYDWGTSNSFERFTATVIAPKVYLSPTTASVTAGDELTLTARLTLTNLSNVTYRWTLLSGTGTLKNTTGGLMGNTLDSSAPTIQYVSDANAQDGDKASVQVEAFQGGVNQTSRTSLGVSAPAAISLLAPAPQTGAPGTFRVSVVVIGDRAAATALVQFSPVAGAKSYTLHGTGGDDVSYGKTISITVNAPVQVTQADGSVIDNAFGLSSAAGPVDRDYVGAYTARFKAFTFTVTANK